jgi:small subunit ribosomal protein S27Ae
VLFNGKQLEDEDVLSMVGVEEEATLNVLARLLGGAKKRKKKTYTKPKKIKHKHKKIKLRVLKFYKVRMGRLFGQAHACMP